MHKTGIFFDARCIRPGMTGVGRYALELLARFCSMTSVRALVLESSLPHLQGLAPLNSVAWIPTQVDYQTHPAGDLWERWTLPKMVRADESFFGPAFLIPGGEQPFRRVAAIHDLGVFKRPEDYSWQFAAYMRWTIRCSARNAKAVIVPTEAVAADLQRFIPKSRAKVCIIPDAPATTLDPGWPQDSRVSNDPFSPPQNPYFISIGTLETRKDPWTALAALEKVWDLRESESPAPKWFWFGGAGQGKLDFLRELRDSLVRDHFRCLGPQNGEAVSAALRGAVALVYPSLDEGFGMPPLEAMAAGVPAVVSDIAPLREVYGDAALYFPPGDSRALAKCLRQMLHDTHMREEMIRRGSEWVGKFSWDATAAKTLEVIVSE